MTTFASFSRIAALSLGTALSLSLATGAAHAADPVSIVVNTMQIFSTLDPAKISDYTDYMAAVNLYDGLTTVSPEGAIVPHLAASWDISADGLTYTFHLRDDVKFSSGHPLSAEDLVWSVERLLAINKGPSSMIAGLIDPANVTAPDAKTVVFKLNRPFSPFLSMTPLFLALDKAEVTAHATAEDKWGEAWVGDHSVGTGPYSLVTYNRAADLVIKRNPAYFLGWAKGTPIDEVRFVQTSDDATVKALAEKGALGLSSEGLANETFDAIAKMPGYKVLQTSTGTGYTLKMNTKVAPTDDVHFRRAIAYALDYATVQTQIHPGEGMAGPLSVKFVDAHDDSIKPQVQDLEKAKAELAQSKYAGQKITLPVSYVASLSYEADTALLLQANLSDLGIDVDIQPQPWNRLVELASKPETTPAATLVNVSANYPSPDAIFYNIYHSKHSGSWWSMEWLQTPEVDALIDKARGETDPAAQNATYKELQQKLVALQPDVWIGASIRRYAANKCLQGYQFIPMQSWELNFSNFWWDCTAK